MKDLERESTKSATCAHSLPINDSGDQDATTVSDLSYSNSSEDSLISGWIQSPRQQVTEHGSKRKTRCPNALPRSKKNNKCVPLGTKILRVLRHAPEDVYLRMDDNGWVHVEQLGEVVNHWCNCNTRWKTSTLQPLMHELGMADRVQFDRDWCRAAYGHSTQLYKPTTFAEPSEPLFHGTRASNWQMIECFGLAPMRRRFVQLTTDFDYAMQIASQEETPIVLQVLRAQAIAEGTRFLSTGSHVWLAEAIPAHLLQVWLPDRS